MAVKVARHTGRVEIVKAIGATTARGSRSR